MGLCNSSETGEPLSFHPHVRGSNISLDSCLRRAERCRSFHHGLLFSDRPLRRKERLKLQVLQEEPRWHGGLRLGFTTVDPSNLETTILPPFACPDLVWNPGFWAVGIPEELCQQGALLSFWVDSKGQALCQAEGELRPRVLFSGVPRKTPLWAIVDVYGQTKAIQLLVPHTPGLWHNLREHRTCEAPRTLHPPLETPSACQCRPEEPSTLLCQPETHNFRLFLEDESTCVICRDRTIDSVLWPCGHCSYCQPCAQRVQRECARCSVCKQNILSIQNITDYKNASQLR
ncbi:E3 ubiquitin-protein ligase NEURL3 isoform X2 [Ascaphus truei]|uniref:E3 ubiquitin-protein ligase NEURL3 isoform X2 n=1 Tax=Ascaphus truei TaxID=8439 RepID=UPI003F5AA8A5